MLSTLTTRSSCSNAAALATVLHGCGRTVTNGMRGRWANGLLSLRWTLVVLCALAALWAPSARADDLSDFEAARARYERHEYARAADAFRGLVGTEPPRIANALLVLESRKYYAASLLFVGNKDEARKQFRLLLQQEPEYALDPLAFPKEVVTLFDQVKSSVRDELAKQREAEQKRELEAQRRARAAEQLERSNLLRLETLAESQELLERNSRWIASVPFGVGQFQNGDRGLGVALAMAQALAVGTSVATYIGHQQVARRDPTMADLEDLRTEERRWRITNWISFSTFAGLALIGIIDAHARFVPGARSARTRPLPPDLKQWLEQRQNTQAALPGFRF